MPGGAPRHVAKAPYTGFRTAQSTAENASAAPPYQVTQYLNLSAAVLNVTDRIVAVDERGRFDGPGGNWMVDEGRRYGVSATVSF